MSGWEGSKRRIRDGECRFGFGRTTIPGCLTLEATLWDTEVPLGTIWFRFVNPVQIDILNIYVMEQVRRSGVATLLLDELIRQYPGTKRVTTGDGTRFGKPWLKSVGFKVDADGHYILRTHLSKKPA